MKSRSFVNEVDVMLHDAGWNRHLEDAEAWAENVVQKVCEFEAMDHAVNVACVLMGDAEIQQLNRDFRHKDSPTNVLSFPADGDEIMHGGFGEMAADIPVALGDVLISIDTLEREAAEQQKKTVDHATHMLVHGVLHLIGYNHIDDEEAEEMEAKEIAILERIGISNPYL